MSLTLKCPQCSYDNPERSIFCARCGYDFRAVNAAQQAQQPYTPTGYGANTGAFAPPAATPPPQQPFSTPAYNGNPGNAGAFPPPASGPMVPPASGYAPPNGVPSTSSYATPQQMAMPSQMQMGTGQGSASIRRAFAGHGTLVAHHSWLIPGSHVQALSLTNAILEKLRQRNVTNLAIKQERLMERGVLTEERDYVTSERSVTTVFTYVAPAGQDLYISRATTVRPTISMVRCIIFGVLLAIALFGSAIAQGIANSAVNSASTTGGALGAYGAALAAQAVGTIVQAFISGPLILLFIVILVRSIIMLIAEKDFWWFLRPSVLNDFQLDDIALMEHLTDEVVHDAVQEMGLDASLIKPPANGYEPKRRIRVI